MLTKGQSVLSNMLLLYFRTEMTFSHCWPDALMSCIVALCTLELSSWQDCGSACQHVCLQQTVSFSGGQQSVDSFFLHFWILTAHICGRYHIAFQSFLYLAIESNTLYCTFRWGKLFFKYSTLSCCAYFHSFYSYFYVLWLLVDTERLN